MEWGVETKCNTSFEKIAVIGANDHSKIRYTYIYHRWPRTVHTFVLIIIIIFSCCLRSSHAAAHGVCVYNILINSSATTTTNLMLVHCRQVINKWQEIMYETVRYIGQNAYISWELTAYICLIVYIHCVRIRFNLSSVRVNTANHQRSKHLALTDGNRLRRNGRNESTEILTEVLLMLWLMWFWKFVILQLLFSIKLTLKKSLRHKRFRFGTAEFNRIF